MHSRRQQAFIQGIHMQKKQTECALQKFNKDKDFATTFINVGLLEPILWLFKFFFVICLRYNNISLVICLL